MKKNSTCALMGLLGGKGALESLLEGTLCLIPYRYWKHQENAAV